MRSKAAGVVLFRRSPDRSNKRTEVLFLLLRNALHRTWGFPKGHLEPGEDDETAMRRELLEETGIASVSIVPGFRESTNYPVRDRDGRVFEKTVAYFLGESPTEEVRLSKEHDEARWAALESALSLIGFENLRRVLRLASERLSAADTPT